VTVDHEVPFASSQLNGLRRKTCLTMKIGFLIHEFPGQAHAFFIREYDQLKLPGIETDLVSTSPPAFGKAQHAWSESAAKRTTYIAPTSFRSMVAVEVFRSSPFGWFGAAVCW